MSNPSNMAATQALGAEFWNDSCDPHELQEAVAYGATGATSNPVIVATAIESHRGDWYPVIDQLILKNPQATEDELAWALIHDLGIKAAKILEPAFLRSQGRKGQLSLQVSPQLYPSTTSMVEQGQKLAQLAPNIAVKLPAIATGIAAMEELTARGISINATVSFSLAQAVACAEAMERGLKRARANNTLKTLPNSFVTLMVGRIDDHMAQVMKDDALTIDPGYVHWAGVAVFKKAYQVFKERGYTPRLLAAAYRHHLHWSELIGKDVVLSMPYKWWKQFEQASIAVQPKLEEPVAAPILKALLDNFADFRKIYDEDGMKTEEFLRYGASRRTLNQFLEGFDKLRSIVRQRMIFQP